MSDSVPSSRVRWSATRPMAPDQPVSLEDLGDVPAEQLGAGTVEQLHRGLVALGETERPVTLSDDRHRHP